TENHIVRLNSSGSVVGSFNIGTGFDDSVFAILPVPSSTDIIVGGDFTHYKGSSVSQLVRLSQTGSLVTDIALGAPANTIESIEAIIVAPDVSTDIYAGGLSTGGDGILYKFTMAGTYISAYNAGGQGFDIEV